MAGNPVTRGKFESAFWLRLAGMVERGLVPMTDEEFSSLEERERDRPWGDESVGVGATRAPLEELLPDHVRNLSVEEFEECEDAVDPFPRRSVWDPLKACKVLAAVRRGADAELLVRVSGVDAADLRGWLAAGEEHARAGRTHHPLAILSLAYEESLALSELNLKGSVLQASRGDWRAGAWMLERTNPEKYGSVADKARFMAMRKMGTLTPEEAASARDRLLAETEGES